MLDQYAEYLTADELAALQTALSQPLYPGIRLNTLKTSDPAAQLGAYAARFGWETEQVPFCATGWQLTQFTQAPGQTTPHRMGIYYIQDAASMIPAEMFSPVSAPLVLDMAAAPGGKTTHLVSHFADKASIVANDSSKKRITALRANLQSWGALGVMTTNYPGEKFGLWFPDTFDAVLLDAPCSGDTLREEKGRKKRDVSGKERTSLSQRQRSLLTSAFYATRVGGEIVYSTCTLNPEENEGVLSAILQNFPLEIETVGNFPQTGILAADFDPNVARATRLWPHLYRSAGFFAARLRKTDHLPPPQSLPPTVDVSSFDDVSPATSQNIHHQLLDAFGFDLAHHLEDKKLVLLSKKDSVYALPERLLVEMRGLPAMSFGLMIGQLNEGNFIPAHELVSRFWREFTGHRVCLSDPQQTQIWLDGRDLRHELSSNYNKGTIVLLENDYGEFIGRGKVLPGRVRNLLPRRVV